MLAITQVSIASNTKRKPKILDEIHTSITTVPIPHEKIALGHLPEVVLMQELAALTLFA